MISINKDREEMSLGRFVEVNALEGNFLRRTAADWAGDEVGFTEIPCCL